MLVKRTYIDLVSGEESPNLDTINKSKNGLVSEVSLPRITRLSSTDSTNVTVDIIVYPDNPVVTYHIDFDKSYGSAKLERALASIDLFMFAKISNVLKYTSEIVCAKDLGINSICIVLLNTDELPMFNTDIVGEKFLYLGMSA